MSFCTNRMKGVVRNYATFAFPDTGYLLLCHVLNNLLQNTTSSVSSMAARKNGCFHGSSFQYGMNDGSSLENDADSHKKTSVSRLKLWRSSTPSAGPKVRRSRQYIVSKQDYLTYQSNGTPRPEKEPNRMSSKRLE
jgi:hypothetical protein